jgi:uncharacterized membrane protein
MVELLGLVYFTTALEQRSVVSPRFLFGSIAAILVSGVEAIIDALSSRSVAAAVNIDR